MMGLSGTVKVVTLFTQNSEKQLEQHSTREWTSYAYNIPEMLPQPTVPAGFLKHQHNPVGLPSVPDKGAGDGGTQEQY